MISAFGVDHREDSGKGAFKPMDGAKFARKYPPGTTKAKVKHVLALHDGSKRAPERVDRLAQNIKFFGQEQPARVHITGEGQAWLANGHHRAMAMKQLGRRKMKVDVRPGTYHSSTDPARGSDGPIDPPNPGEKRPSWRARHGYGKS